MKQEATHKVLVLFLTRKPAPWSDTLAHEVEREVLHVCPPAEVRTPSRYTHRFLTERALLHFMSNEPIVIHGKVATMRGRVRCRARQTPLGSSPTVADLPKGVCRAPHASWSDDRGP